MTVRPRASVAALGLVLVGCGSPYVEEDAVYVAPTVETARNCVSENGAWCLTTAQAAVTQNADDSLYWTVRDTEDNTGLIVAPKSCRGGPADGVFRRTSGTVLREGENWKIARIGLRADRSCEMLFMAPESSAASLRTLFLTRVNVCIAGTDCASVANVLVNRIGPDDLF